MYAVYLDITLLHMMCVCAQSLSHVQLFVTLWTAALQAPLPMGIFQARILEWVAMLSSRGSSQLRDQTQISHITDEFFTIWATREVLVVVIEKEKQIKRIQTGKKEAKLSLFVKDIIFIYGKIKRLHNKLLELINSIMLENEKSIPKICYVFMH